MKICENFKQNWREIRQKFMETRWKNLWKPDEKKLLKFLKKIVKISKKICENIQKKFVKILKKIVKTLKKIC